MPFLSPNLKCPSKIDRHLQGLGDHSHSPLMSEVVLLSLLCPPMPALSCHACGELTKPMGKARAEFTAHSQQVFQRDPLALPSCRRDFPFPRTQQCAMAPEIDRDAGGRGSAVAPAIFFSHLPWCRGKMQLL